MASDLSFDAHPSAEMLEEYAFRRLPEVAAESLEEHLLLCAGCQKKLQEVDEYILLMKHATAGMDSGSNPTAAGEGRTRWGVLAGGAMAMALIVAAVMSGIKRPDAGAAAQQVELAAFRGDEMAHATAGQPIPGVIDAADLAGPRQYNVEVVTASGGMGWKGPAMAAEGRLSASISAKLKRGVYWVRLSTSEGELVREYGLRAD